MNLLEDEAIVYKSLSVMSMVVIIVGGMKLASAILTPFLLSLFLAIIAASFMNFFIRKGMPQLLSWLLVFTSVIAFILIMGVFMSSSLYELQAKLPEYLGKLDALVDHYIMMSTLDAETLSKQIKSLYHPGALLQHSVTAMEQVSALLSNSFLVILTVIFMLVQRQTFVHKVAYLADNPKSYRHFDKIIQKVDQYMLILSFISMLTGLTVYIVLSLMGIDFALTWALMAFFLNFIPNIGSFLAAIPPMLLALIEFDLSYAALVGFFYVVMNTLYGNVLQPRIIGKGLDLSILVVFLSLVFWGWVFGVIGMVLSIPLTVVFKIILESNEKSRWVAVMLGNDPYEKERQDDN